MPFRLLILMVNKCVAASLSKMHCFSFELSFQTFFCFRTTRYQDIHFKNEKIPKLDSKAPSLLRRVGCKGEALNFFLVLHMLAILCLTYRLYQNFHDF